MRISFMLLFICLCSYSTLSNAKPKCSQVSSTWNFNIPVTVYPDTPAGTELASQTLSGALYNCTYLDIDVNSNSQTISMSTGVVPWDVSPDGIQIYPTSTPGIGYAVGMYVPNCGSTDITWLSTLSNGNTTSSCSQPTPIGKTINADITVKLYKTASNVSIGTVGSAVTLAFVNTTFNSPLTSDSSTSIGLYLYGFTVTQATCMVVNRNLQVTLDPVSRFIFNGVGSTTNQGAKDFNISVKCQKSTNVKMQIDGVNTFDASKGVLGEESGHEIGVGIQLLYKDLPVTFGSAFDVGTVNPTLDIPLKARYYQTASTINPGTIGSFATFTMTYN